MKNNKFKNWLEEHAISNLMVYLIIAYGVGFVLTYINPYFYYMYLSLDVEQILNGQIWRIITFLCYPPSTSILFFILLSLIYFSLGKTLETVWGTYRFNLYIFIGIFGYILAAFIIYFIYGTSLVGGFPLTASKLYLSMLLGLAITIPDTTFLLYFIIPIKAKWLGLVYAGIQIYEIVIYAINGDWAGVISTVLALLNVIVFIILIKKDKASRGRGPYAGGTRAEKSKVVFHIHKDGTVKDSAGNVVREGRTATTTRVNPRHRCAVCGITDIDAPNMEFRYCSKCEGAYEYCSQHLRTHQHVKSENSL